MIKPSHNKDIALTRRGMLKVGAFTLGATASAFSPWNTQLQATTIQPVLGKGKAESVLVLWMAGGVTQYESFDPKMEAPLEIRGKLQDIQTSLSGAFSRSRPINRSIVSKTSSMVPGCTYKKLFLVSSPNCSMKSGEAAFSVSI